MVVFWYRGRRRENRISMNLINCVTSWTCRAFVRRVTASMQRTLTKQTIYHVYQTAQLSADTTRDVSVVLSFSRQRNFFVIRKLLHVHLPTYEMSAAYLVDH